MLIGDIIDAKKGKGIVRVKVSTYFTEKQGNTGVYNVSSSDLGDYSRWRRQYASEKDAKDGHQEIVASLQRGIDLGIISEPKVRVRVTAA